MPTLLTTMSGPAFKLMPLAQAAALTFGILAAAVAADGQPAKVPRIGWLSPVSSGAGSGQIEAFRRGLRAAGRVEGRNLVVEYRWADGRFDRLPALATDLVGRGVDVILAHSTPAILAAAHATRTIPIVMVAVADPVVASGLVKSLARPGGNVTGLSILAPELAAKRLALLKEVVPNVSQVAVIWNPASPGATALMKETQLAAESLGLTLQLIRARDPAQYDAAFGAISPRSGALLVLPDSSFLAHRARLADLALKRRVPAMYWEREHVEAGGLMSYSVSVPDLFRRAAHYVDRILKGAKPAGLPVERPTKFELVINLRTARALDLRIPPSVLARADQLIR